ncbi:MAG: hypothetical protein ACOZNI_27255 [Myxococcota bacterium]
MPVYPPEPEFEKGEKEIQCFRLQTSPEVVWFRGVTTNFQAILIAGGASVLVKGVHFQVVTDERDESVTFRGSFAREVRVGSMSLRELPGCGSAAPATGGVFDGDSGAGDPRSLTFWRSTVPIVVDSSPEHEFEFEVAIAR